jgi:hypothetical protein
MNGHLAMKKDLDWFISIMKTSREPLKTHTTNLKNI